MSIVIKAITSYGVKDIVLEKSNFVDADGIILCYEKNCTYLYIKHNKLEGVYVRYYLHCALEEIKHITSSEECSVVLVHLPRMIVVMNKWYDLDDNLNATNIEDKRIYVEDEYQKILKLEYVDGDEYAIQFKKKVVLNSDKRRILSILKIHLD